MHSHRSGLRFVRSLVLALLAAATVAACSFGDPATSLPAIIGAAEPGPRLTVEGRVVDASSGEPIEGAQLIVYQTDQTGTYQPEDPADESTARIRGEFETGSDGAFGFVTVQPGEYPDQPSGNRHIHFHSVTAEGYTSKGFVMLFDDNVRSEVRAWAESTGFGIVVPVSGDPTNGLATSIDIALDPDS